MEEIRDNFIEDLTQMGQYLAHLFDGQESLLDDFILEFNEDEEVLSDDEEKAIYEGFFSGIRRGTADVEFSSINLDLPVYYVGGGFIWEVALHGNVTFRINGGKVTIHMEETMDENSGGTLYPTGHTHVEIYAPFPADRKIAHAVRALARMCDSFKIHSSRVDLKEVVDER
jgi:hypothetical protein